MEKPHRALLFLLLQSLFFPKPISVVDFVFNGFDASSDVLLYGNATIGSRILTLTNKTSLSIGRALYGTKIRTKHPENLSVLPFSTSFIFSMVPFKNTLPGHGIVFIFVPFAGIQGASSSQHLGLFNLTNNGNPNNRIFGVEFDVFANQEFNDIDANHVGIDVNSLTSIRAYTAGYWLDDQKKRFKKVKLNNGRNYQVWIDYKDSLVNVTMAPVGEKRPKTPLLSVALNLSDVFVDEMYVGFAAATGRLVQSHKILAWSFSNSNFSLSRSLITTGLPSFILSEDSILQTKWFISILAVISFVIVVSVVLLSLILIRRKQERARRRAEMEDWELEYWPHRMPYQEIEAATKGFSEENVTGIGGNGKVYKGVLAGGVDVAVKRISHENNDGMREFLAEVASLGRLKHRNLVGLRGWCKQDKGSFMLIFDYMENGSLDKRVFENPNNSEILSCKERIRILKDVAQGVLYLHEGWEAKVLHRDIKASNVLLDRDMNGRLGDFGLARMHDHGEAARTTRVVGTVGYLAPEVVRTGRASVQTDVFGFGVLVLEVMCGRRPIVEGKPNLVDWVWQLMVRGEIINALDPRIRVHNNTFDEEEVEKVLQLGLLCSYPDPNSRPTMRQVVQVLEGKKSGESNEAESEDMEAYLLQKVKSREMWTNYAQNFRYGSSSHPMFEEIKQSHSSSMSHPSWTTSIMEAR